MSHSFTLQNNGSSTELSMGEVFDVVLAENPTTGYRWILDVSPSQAIVLVSDEFDEFTVSGEGIGTGGQRRFLLRAGHPGAFVITLRCCREWESATPAIKTFTLTGVVS
ncbi:MAG: protease inhibitor I42 family protein [Microcystis sp. M038S2]|jgi:inhibitor of cysteine peptidase|uniref:Proteinase inhibitor I42 chagasin domain-containing protein n=3 Tax=Microcystis TaxID=1125 RepID=A0A552J6L9_9CHRO|nr:protease inhibitor I42 family protein [Microcystis sp. M046S2]MCA2703493.1 protease inhibitor I42 family protein [Microcystis sp. M038S2]MCA2953747.1 protease inhibitor I42 family protein [Microcystis sp. M112S1]NCQ71612.1 protease inhibitor I42 family protein [Microcystis aeruginosa W13-16]NCQ76095.1 protease inhibitor I42 family protein [Microcystis aeruginosa W13-13]NCQ80595.1 protease inhibitor I42 family protein [Microcystis aeruginosa W13-15]NCR24331.1 protease inhibitor I42 family p